MDPPLRAALEDPSFAPIPTPSRGDWVSAHWELAQTFDDFSAESAPRPDAARRKLYLLPLESFQGHGPGLETLRGYLQAFFGLEAVLLPVSRADAQIASRLNPQTGAPQLLTRDILARLRKLLPRDGFVLIAVTMEDLYPAESWNFVFGQASPRDRVGVFSFARYDPRFYGQPAAAPLLLRRSIKVLSHEMGHMFGMRHCRFFSCNMNGSNHLTEADAQPLSLCPVCLRKLQHSAGFDAARRYRELEAFYRSAGYAAEADLTAARAARMHAAPAHP